MTVTTLNNKDYGTGDGVMTVFPFTFRLQQASDLDVYVDDSLVVGGYTVAIDSSGVGGNVTFAVAPVNGADIVFVRVVDLTQPLSLPVESNFSELDITNALDKLTMEVQQNAEAIGRSITLPITSSISGLTLPEPSALQILRWNATADALENVDINVTGGGILGPGATTANNLPLWNNTTGTLLKNGVAPVTAGYVLTDNGPGNAPTFQASAGGDFLPTTTKSGSWTANTAGTAVEYPVDCTSASTCTIPAATGSRKKVRLYITTGTAVLSVVRSGSDQFYYPTGLTALITMRGANKGFLDLQDAATGFWRVI